MTNPRTSPVWIPLTRESVKSVFGAFPPAFIEWMTNPAVEVLEQKLKKEKARKQSESEVLRGETS